MEMKLLPLTESFAARNDSDFSLRRLAATPLSGILAVAASWKISGSCSKTLLPEKHV
jgi:hypothetical protein